MYCDYQVMINEAEYLPSTPPSFSPFLSALTLLVQVARDPPILCPSYVLNLFFGSYDMKVLYIYSRKGHLLLGIPLKAGVGHNYEAKIFLYHDTVAFAMALIFVKPHYNSCIA